MTNKEGVTWWTFPGRRFAELHFTFGLSAHDPIPAEKNLVARIEKQWSNIGVLEEVGKGGDMIAYSHPTLDWVVKLHYNDSFDPPVRRQWPPRIKHGFSLAKECLGGIVVPTLDMPLTIKGETGPGNVVTAVIQQKVITVKDAFGELSLWEDTIIGKRIKRALIVLNQRMWERGIFDRDPTWEENYGFLPSGQFVAIDIGDLSDSPEEFPFYEGLPREHLYEPSLRKAFSQENFRRFFGRNLDARTYASAIIVGRAQVSR